jgi:hypothetical protein
MDASKWLAVVGVISALTLGVGFITGLISVGLGLKVNRQQNVEVARANESAAEAKLKADKLEGDNLALRGQVATLETAAADAKKDVAGLQKAAADAQIALEEQKGRTATLESAAADAKAAQQRVEADLAIQQARAAIAEQKAEAERLRRVGLEDSIAPRLIVNNLTLVEELRKLHGIRVILEYVNETEPRQMTNQLMGSFAGAGWTVLSREPLAYDSSSPNITVIARPGIAAQDDDHAPAAAEALIAGLATNKIEASLAPQFSLPANTIKVRVGLKEATYLRREREEELYRNFLFNKPSSPLSVPLPEQKQFRHFTEAEQKRFIDELGKFVWAGKFPVELRCPADDDEACGYAMEIALLLRRAGWEIHNNSLIRDKEFPSNVSFAEFARDKTGVAVIARWVSQNNSSVPVASAFEAIGRSVWRTTDVFDQSVPLLILVGLKHP